MDLVKIINSDPEAIVAYEITVNLWLDKMNGHFPSAYAKERVGFFCLVIG